LAHPWIAIDITSVISTGSSFRDPHPYYEHYPSPELRKNVADANKVGWAQIQQNDQRVFGLGSLYVFVSCASDALKNEVLYVGRAGANPVQARIADHIQTAVGKPVTFPNHKWANSMAEDAKEAILRGAFYVVSFVNMAPWGKFENPYTAEAKNIGFDPFEEISKDLEAWVMQQGGLPPLNARDERSRQVSVNLPWGSKPCV
jgi:hypothetical protein